MSAPARFKQADLTRAIVGAKKAGLRVGSVEIDANGKIVILTDRTAQKPDAKEWDTI